MLTNFPHRKVGVLEFQSLFNNYSYAARYIYDMAYPRLTSRRLQSALGLVYVLPCQFD